MLSEDPILRAMQFLKPEDFYYSSLYLLFSSDRTHEKEYEAQIREAFQFANLSSKRFIIKNKVIVLECSKYEVIRIDGKLGKSQSSQFSAVSAPSFYSIPAGEAPPKLSPSSLENKVYNFKQIVSSYP